MTIIEAENQYEREVAYLCERHTEKAKKMLVIYNIVCSILIMIGIVLMVVGFATPPEIDSFGHEWDTTGALLEKMFGAILLFVCTVFILILNIGLRRAIKNGPRNVLPQIKNLYLNYLRCDDMNENDKEFYKQKLEEIRYTELVSAINRASASASMAIMFSALKK